MPRTATLSLLMAVSLLMLPLAMSSLRGASTAAPGQSLLPICGEPRSLWNMGGDRAVILRADGLLEALPLGRPGAVEWSLNGANQAVRAGERLAVYT
ncbi:MAG: hypothetical protein QI199_05895, partial [Candidatus Korarchaeota archaeon]|nr:hypothetical protein [Candidatus Korarchaeota archaeon]